MPLTASERTLRCMARKKGLDVPKMKPGPKRNDFWTYVDKSDGCWLFTGSKHPFGYGVWTENGKTVHAHRYSWELGNGPIPKGGVIMHKCDNPPCVNPDHLVLGSHSANRRDAISKNRHARGERNGHAKLTEDAVREIRRLHASGIGYTRLSKRFNVDRALVWRVVAGKSWGHVV